MLIIEENAWASYFAQLLSIISRDDVVVWRDEGEGCVVDSQSARRCSVVKSK
jgi:hypothetical protein